MGPAPYEVRWELASDDAFGAVVQTGSTIANPALAHSVHVDVTGLQPATEYFYRFKVGNEESPVGRTRTAPTPDMAVPELHFAFTGCAHYEHGYYRHIAERAYGVVFNLGVYIYAVGPGAYNV